LWSSTPDDLADLAFSFLEKTQQITFSLPLLTSLFEELQKPSSNHPKLSWSKFTTWKILGDPIRLVISKKTHKSSKKHNELNGAMNQQFLGGIFAILV
jgi:muramoyltetrapeptide carboxypeptidase LdcA involved in peptidoglycan recycling